MAGSLEGGWLLKFRETCAWLAPWKVVGCSRGAYCVGSGDQIVHATMRTNSHKWNVRPSFALWRHVDIPASVRRTGRPFRRGVFRRSDAALSLRPANSVPPPGVGGGALRCMSAGADCSVVLLRYSFAMPGNHR